jgi:hypothetical protein
MPRASRSRVATRAALVAFCVALAVTLGSCAFTSDISGSLTGKVRAAGTSLPIEGALVECEGILTVSSADGSYDIEGISPGERVVYATAGGYEDYSQIVQIDDSTLHDIYMSEEVLPANISGHVSHATLGPLEGAVLQIGDLTETTDSLGYYAFPTLEQNETYTMVVSKDGYRQVSLNVRPNSEYFDYAVSLKKLATITFWSNADATIHESLPGTNFGDNVRLDLYDNGFVGRKRFYIRFDLSGIEETAVPIEATLRLCHIETHAEEGLRTLLVARVLQPWTEGVITWSNVPATTGASGVQGEYEYPWYEAQVATFFSDWIAHGASNYGLLVDTPTNHEADAYVFASREHEDEDKRPHVVLDYAW